LSALIKPRLLVGMLAVVTCFVLAGPIVSTAAASDNSIIGVVNHWSPIVQRDETAIAKAEKAYKNNRQAGPVVADLTHEVGDLHLFVSQLKAQSASTSTGGNGRNDIAAGATLVAKSYASFARELKQAGSKGLSPAQITANSKIALAGHKKIVAGIKLLQSLT
jgi:hypothetical protein